MKRISSIAVILVVGAVIALIFGGILVSQAAQPTQATTISTGTTVSSPTVEFSITVQDSKTPFAFVYDSQSNPTLHVKLGDTVKITLTNTGTQPHDFILEGYNIKTKVLNSGQSDSIVFTADKAGTFTYYCSVPGHKDLGMQGQFVVE